MSKSEDMRRLIDLANNNKIVSESYSNNDANPFKTFSSWGKMSEGWDDGFKEYNSVETNVWQDTDPLGNGEWFWTRSKGGHIIARGGGCHSEEEARAECGEDIRR